jgi:hypothetical protein
VWAASEAQDPIARLATLLSPDFHGNPSSPHFGARVFSAAAPGLLFPGLEHRAAHSSYLGPGSEALPNIGAIAAGHYDRVTVPAMQFTGSLAEQIELAAWEHEARGPDGEWVHGGAATIERVTHPIGDEGARGNSRPVSHDEFQAMAAEGRDRLRAIQSSPWSVSGLDASWPDVKARTFAEVQKPWGGATVDPRTGQDLPQGADKFAMSVKPTGMDTTSVPEGASRQAFDEAMDAALAKYSGQLAKGGSYLGIFHDDDLGRIDIDPVTVLDTQREVETIGAWTHAIGGAYRFSDGNGYWPPHVPGSANMAAENKSDHHWAGPGQWHSQAVELQDGHDDPDDDDGGSISAQIYQAG